MKSTSGTHGIHLEAGQLIFPAFLQLPITSHQYDFGSVCRKETKGKLQEGLLVMLHYSHLNFTSSRVLLCF